MALGGGGHFCLLIVSKQALGAVISSLLVPGQTDAEMVFNNKKDIKKKSNLSFNGTTYRKDTHKFQSFHNFFSFLYLLLLDF